MINIYDVDQEEANLEIEEALEFLYDRIEAGKCITITDMNSEYPDIVQSLEQYDLISINNDEEISFTEKGNIQGIKVIRRHRLAERLFHDLLQIENDLLENTACEFEHTIKKEVEQRVCALLGHPRLCPHNKKIPPGDCCKKRLNVKKIIAPLVEMKVGEKGN
ncbi:MAG: metal-dependent transcriptional regulator, partial [Candidatus Thorarchaeota archaeon]